jgi:hypothetical protein
MRITADLHSSSAAGVARSARGLAGGAELLRRGAVVQAVVDGAGRVRGRRVVLACRQIIHLRRADVPVVVALDHPVLLHVAALLSKCADVMR